MDMQISQVITDLVNAYRNSDIKLLKNLTSLILLYLDINSYEADAYIPLIISTCGSPPEEIHKFISSLLKGADFREVNGDIVIYFNKKENVYIIVYSNNDSKTYIFIPL